MRTATLSVFLLLLLAAQAEPPPALQVYLGVPRYDRPRWDPAGRRLAFLSEGQLYLRETAGRTRLLNRALRPVTAFFWTSDGRSLLLEVGRESRSRLYRVDAVTGRSEALAAGRRAVLGGDEQLAYASDDGSVMLMSLAERKPRALYSGTRPAPARFSPDGKRLLVLNERSALDGELVVVDLATGRARVLASGARFSDPRWSGNRRVRALTDRGGDLLTLQELDLDKRRWTTLASGPGELEAYVGGPKDTLAYVVNEGGASRLYSGGKPMATPTGVIRNLALRPDGQLAFWLSGPTQPGSAWLADPATGKVTRVLGPAVAQLRLTTPRRVELPGSLPALLYDGPPGSPAVILLHGGPANQSRPEFSPLLQYLASRGYTLLLPDYRGSLGYGRAYLAADDGPLRVRAVDDVLAAGRWLADRGHPRIALAGFSYGGFLALAALAREPDSFCGAVSLSGITDLASFVQSQPGRRETRLQEYGADAALLAELSPLNQVPRLSRPVLVVHGDRDERVPMLDTLKFVAGLRERGATVEFLRLEEEGHGLTSAASRGAGYGAIVDFLGRITGP